jgi:hypothetical protein
VVDSGAPAERQAPLASPLAMDGRMPGRLQRRIAVIVPAGPRDDALDTLASVVRYTSPSRIIIVIDDRSGLASKGGQIRSLSNDIVVIPAVAGVPGGAFGGLWVKLAAGYRWLLERYRPGIVLRLDTDALLIGPGLETAAEQAFAARPEVGLLGAYRIGPDGGSRDNSWAAQQIRAEAGLRGLLHPKRRAAIRSHLRLARENGYQDGEHVLGAACIHSFGALSRIYENGWFSEPWIKTSHIGDDHYFSLLTVAAGYQIADFGGPSDPLALRWQGLPAHPADLLAAGKLATHSVRFWQDLGERQIRDIFARARSRDHDSPIWPSPSHK